MTRLKLMLASLAFMAAAGCAKDPSRIEPVAMPAGAYAPMSCSSLAAEHAANKQELDALSKAQKNAATGDAVGVLLIGVPLSSLGGGDKEAEIAAAKGRQYAIEAEMVRKGC